MVTRTTESDREHRTQRIRDMRQAGLTMLEITQRIPCSMTTVQRALLNWKVPIPEGNNKVVRYRVNEDNQFTLLAVTPSRAKILFALAKRAFEKAGFELQQEK